MGIGNNELRMIARNRLIRCEEDQWKLMLYDFLFHRSFYIKYEPAPTPKPKGYVIIRFADVLNGAEVIFYFY